MKNDRRLSPVARKENPHCPQRGQGRRKRTRETREEGEGEDEGEKEEEEEKEEREEEEQVLDKLREGGKYRVVAWEGMMR